MISRNFSSLDINEKYKYENGMKDDTNDQEESEEVDLNKVEEQRFTSTQDLWTITYLHISFTLISQIVNWICVKTFTHSTKFKFENWHFGLWNSNPIPNLFIVKILSWENEWKFLPHNL